MVVLHVILKKKLKDFFHVWLWVVMKALKEVDNYVCHSLYEIEKL